MSMRVEIPVEILRDRDGSEKAELVLRLISFFREARHDWALSPSDVDAVYEFCRRHVPTLAQAYLLLAQKASMAHFWAPHSSSSGTVKITSETLKDDVGDLERSAVLVVENAIYDWQMIEALARILGCSDVVQAKVDNRLDVYNGGGKDGAFRHAIDQIARFSRIRRVVLVVDSDRFHPGETTESHQRAGEMEDRGGHAHVLRFREMENYIPTRVLARQAKKTSSQAGMAKRLESLNRLSDEQRAYFDIKHGFKGKSTKGSRDARKKPRHPGKSGTTFHVPSQHRGLYDNVDERDLIALREGFGTDLPNLFLQEVQTGGVSEKDLESLGADATQELRLMLDKIRKVI